VERKEKKKKRKKRRKDGVGTVPKMRSSVAGMSGKYLKKRSSLSLVTYWMISLSRSSSDDTRALFSCWDEEGARAVAVVPVVGAPLVTAEPGGTGGRVMAAAEAAPPPTV